MQMHSGPLDAETLNRFASHHEAVDRYQILEFLNIDNGEIELNGQSLISSTQDNGISTQSGAFDYLLDLDGAVITPAVGDIYVPVCYMQEAAMKTGDTVSICGIPFRAAGFLRDSQMNSMLSSSKRFLVSPQDFERLRDLGTMEHLIAVSYTHLDVYKRQAIFLVDTRALLRATKSSSSAISCCWRL